jgi:hypothetical protein
MPISVQPVFGEYSYDPDATIEEWTDEPTLRGGVSAALRSDIGRAEGGYLGPRRISARGVIGPDGGGSRDELRAIEDAFRWAHRTGYRVLQRDGDRYVTAEVRRVTLGADQGYSWMPFAVEWEAADPYWYSTSTDDDLWTGPTNGGTRPIANAGSAATPAVFTIIVASGVELTLTLTNSTTGQSFTLTELPVAGGDELVVDCGAQTVELEGVNRMRYFSGSFWHLAPGSNTITLALSGVTLTSIETELRQRWL